METDITEYESENTVGKNKTTTIYQSGKKEPDRINRLLLRVDRQEKVSREILKTGRRLTGRVDKQENLVLFGYFVMLLMVVGLFFQVQLMTNEANNTKEIKFEELSRKIDDLNKALGND